MKRKTFTIATPDGPHEVSGLVTDCGLVGVHKVTGQYDINRGLYSVTHTPTGWRLRLCAAHRVARETALAVAELSGLEVDTPEALARVPGLAELLDWRDTA